METTNNKELVKALINALNEEIKTCIGLEENCRVARRGANTAARKKDFLFAEVVLARVYETIAVATNNDSYRQIDALTIELVKAGMSCAEAEGLVKEFRKKHSVKKKSTAKKASS